MLSNEQIEELEQLVREAKHSYEDLSDLSYENTLVLLQKRYALDAAIHKNAYELILLARNAQIYLKALKEVDTHWFDKRVVEGACLICDLGGAGMNTNEDGHDENCWLSIVHKALREADSLEPATQDVKP